VLPDTSLLLFPRCGTRARSGFSGSLRRHPHSRWILLSSWVQWARSLGIHVTTLQNDPQQHQCGAENRKLRIQHAGRRSPNSESVCREISKSGLAPHCGPRNYDFTSDSDGETTAGAPMCTRVRPSRIQGITETSLRKPLPLTGICSLSGTHEPDCDD
jgi:hypothetical protein